MNQTFMTLGSMLVFRGIYRFDVLKWLEKNPDWWWIQNCHLHPTVSNPLHPSWNVKLDEKQTSDVNPMDLHIFQNTGKIWGL